MFQISSQLSGLQGRCRVRHGAGNFGDSGHRPGQHRRVRRACPCTMLNKMPHLGLPLAVLELPCLWKNRKKGFDMVWSFRTGQAAAHKCRML